MEVNTYSSDFLGRYQIELYVYEVWKVTLNGDTTFYMLREETDSIAPCITISTDISDIYEYMVSTFRVFNEAHETDD